MSRIVFNKYGSGKVNIIVFPGWVHPVENENKFLNLLKKKYTVVSVYPPGYVNNPDQEVFHDFPQLAKEIGNKLKKYKNKKCVYMGFSMGCRLLMEVEKIFPSKHKKILIGCPVGDYEVPVWGKVILSQIKLLNLVRKSDRFKFFVVTKAVRSISGKNNAVFRGRSVTVTGGFDSLVGLLRSRTNFKQYINSAKFIYGGKDKYFKLAKNFDIKNLSVIRRAKHNCVRGHEEEVIKEINLFIKR